MRRPDIESRYRVRAHCCKHRDRRHDGHDFTTTCRTASDRSASGEIPPGPGTTGVKVSALGLGGYHIGAIEERARSDPHRPRGHRRRHHVHGQRLGVSRRPIREDHGQGDRRPARPRVPDDEGLHARPRQARGDAPARTVAAAAEDRLPRPLADPRVRLRQRPRAPLRAARRRRSARCAQSARARCGFVGFTGHKHPEIHLAMLAHDFPFDTCQLPLNCFDASFRSFEQQVLPELLAPRHRADRHEEPRRRRAAGEAAHDHRRGRAALRDEPAGGDHVSRHRLDARAAAEPARRRGDSGRCRRGRWRRCGSACEPRRPTAAYELYKTTARHEGTVGRKQHGFPDDEELSG